MNAVGSGNPRKVPNASRMMWSAAARSSSRSGPTVTVLIRQTYRVRVYGQARPVTSRVIVPILKRGLVDIRIEVSRVDRSARGSLAPEQSILEAFLALPLSRIDPDADDEVRRILTPGRQRGLDEGVTFNSGI